MYKILISIIAFFVLLFVYTKTAGPIPFSVNSVNTTKFTTFDVTGEGKVSVKPDIAMLTVGITANSPTIKAAQDQINTAINNISAAIKQLGVDQKDIQTTNYSINPTYDYTGGTQKITGYSASTNLSIKVRQIDKVNEVIDLATKNGANQIGGVSFDVDDKSVAQNQAREQAVADAKKKAEQAIKIAGLKLGRVINYQESFNNSPRPIMAYSMMGGGAAKEATPPTQVETGSSEIDVTVTLSYEIQ